MPTAFWATIAGILGLAVGSFLNVVIYRVPAGESVVHPPSKCPNCGAPIRNRHNVPVLGWLVLRGRCYDCHAPISPRYPIVEAATGALFAAVTIRIVDLHLGEALPAYLYLTAIGVALTMIDIDVKRLPDKIVLPSYPVLAALLLIATIDNSDWWALGRAGIGMALLYAFYFLTAFIYPAGMGFGDVKLSGLLGGMLAYLSWKALAVGAVGGFVLGAVGSLFLLAFRRAGRKSEIPFGPYMIAAALLAVFVANPIANAYLHLLHH
ncbi:MAG TPA: prepilin peptidase [Jatrophihabitantaceae bacterium]|nr:prepilin peptidase [Jatrophihabitantaceae bacterium]